MPTVHGVVVPALQCLFASAIWEEQLHAHTAQRAHAHTCMDAHKKARARDALHIHAACARMHGMSAHTHARARIHSRPLTARHLCAASDFSLCFVLCPCFCFHKLSVPLLPSSHSLVLAGLISADSHVMSRPPVC